MQAFKTPRRHLLAIIVTGLGIGFLIGFSASSVVNSLIWGIVSLAAGVVSALCGVRLEKADGDAGSSGSVSTLNGKVSPVPRRASHFQGAILFNPWHGQKEAKSEAVKNSEGKTITAGR